MTELKIIKAFPNENWHLLIEFSNGEFGKFSCSSLLKGFSFLSHPLKFKSFIQTEDYIEWLPALKEESKGYYSDQIIWTASGKLSAEFLYGSSKICTLENIANECFIIGRKNQAPTDKHKTHHEYSVYIRPFNLKKQISLSQSIGGGHAEMGGWYDIAFEELTSNLDWEQHFVLSDCKWAIDILKKPGQTNESAIQALFAEVRNRASLHPYELP